MKILIVGGGRATAFLAANLAGRGHEVTIVSIDSAACVKQAMARDSMVVCGDGSDPAVLEDAGAAEADIVLAATGSDADNLVVCQLSRIRFGVQRAIAIVNDPENTEPFRRLGIDSFSTTETVASLIEQRVAIDRVMDIIPAVGGEVSISELVLDADSVSVGQSLAELALPEGALVAVVARRGSSIIPRGTTRFEADDRILLVALAGTRRRAIKLLVGGSEN